LILTKWKAFHWIIEKIMKVLIFVALFLTFALSATVTEDVFRQASLENGKADILILMEK
jgi:hypothetical protein